MWAALGNFDGVHLGHRQVIRPVLSSGLSQSVPDAAIGAAGAKDTPFAELTQPQLAQSLEFAQSLGLAQPIPSPSPVPLSLAPEVSPDAPRVYSTVLTFSPHPQEFFSGQPKALLTPVAEKAQYLDRLGIEQLVLLPFNRELATLSPEAFVEQVLVERLQVRGVSVGQDFCFGARRSGTAQELQAIAARYGIPVVITPLQSLNQERISSSGIRDALLMGEVERVRALLGRPYGIQGEVVRGQQLGRSLGFPTANLKLPPQKFVPRQGVYGVWVQNLSAPSWPPMPGVMNIGTRPTIAGQHQTLEVHILPQEPPLPPLNLYGQTLAVALVKFLRSEQKFDSLADLKAQIAKDCAIAQSLLREPPAPDIFSVRPS